MNIQDPIWGDKFMQRLRRVASGVLDSNGYAEEIVQEAYLRYLEIESGTIENPSRWLFTVTRNLAVDRARRITRERERLLLVPGSDFSEHLDDCHEIESRLAELIACLIQGSGSHTACMVLLHVVFGVSYDDIATIAGRSPAACRQSVSRALRKCFNSIDSNESYEEPAEANIYVHAVLDASMTPLIENLGGALTAGSKGFSVACPSGYELRTIIKTGTLRQALVIKASGVQWVLIRDGHVLCVLGNAVRIDATV